MQLELDKPLQQKEEQQVQQSEKLQEQPDTLQQPHW